MNLIDEIRKPIAPEMQIFKRIFADSLRSDNPLLSSINDYVLQGEATSNALVKFALFDVYLIYDMKDFIHQMEHLCTPLTKQVIYQTRSWLG